MCSMRSKVLFERISTFLVLPLKLTLASHTLPAAPLLIELN